MVTTKIEVKQLRAIANSEKPEQIACSGDG
jgi:hypothetical protein